MVKNSKTLKLVVCMSLIVALAISALGLSVRAIYENSHFNSGNQASDIVGVASTQVGYGEGSDGYTKYGDWYGLPNSDWCAMFVSWCANQAGVSTDVFPPFALCSAGADWFISEGRFHYAGSYAPQAGDLIFYSSYGDIYHVGLVTGSDSSNVYSIEGNYNEAVYNVSYPLSYGDILGYATPAYNTTAAVEPDPEPAKEEESDSEITEVTEDTEEVVSEEPAEADKAADEADETDEDVKAEEAKTEDGKNESEAASEAETDKEEPETDSEKASDEDKASDTDTDTKVLVGDVNGDGVVDSADALLIQRYLAGKLDDEEKFIFLAADVDGSGEIDIADALSALEISIAA